MTACLLSACGDPSPLRIGSNQWPAYEPLYLARDAGLYGDAGIRLIEMPSASDVMQHLRLDNLEGGALTLDETLTLLSEGVDLAVVAVLDVSNGADALIARPGIERLDQLRGKRLGVELSAVGALMLDAVLRAARLGPGDLTTVPLTVDEHAKAFEAGRVDAVITFEPTRSRLIEAGGRQLFDSRRIPGRIIDVLAIRHEAIERQPGRVRALLRGYFAARSLLRAEPGRSAARMAPRLGLDARQLLNAYAGMRLPDLAGNRRWLKGPKARLPAVARRLLALMHRQGLIDRMPSIEALADARWLPETP